MTRHALRLYLSAVFLLLAALLPGCPRNIFNPGDFLSALPGGYGRGTDFVDSPTAGAPEDDGEGDNGGEVREVVEPDVIRKVGQLLYVLNQHRGLSIIDLDSETLLSQTGTTGLPRDLYIVDDRAYVLVAQASSPVFLGDVASIGISGTVLHVVDISDPSAPLILTSFELEGDLVDSRLVGDVLYAVGAEYQYYWPGEGDVPTEPGVVDGSPGQAIKQQTTSSWVNSVDVSNPANVRVVDTLSFAGYGDVIQATSTAIFVAGHSWESDAATITYVDIADAGGAIEVRGSVQVPGHIADRFKMDSYEGVLRVVSNTSWPQRQTYVSTIPLADPDNLAVLGQTTIPAAENETLFATRFDGPTAYAVTYLVVDPLFVLDLSDPANPKVTGELVVPGWSTHIEPRGDRLIALGVDDTNGRRVSVSLFDVSDPTAPALLARESFGDDWSWSNAYQDVKSFSVLDDTIIVPFGGWNEQGGYDRLQFISYTRDTLDARGHVDLRGQAVRSFEYAGHYYGVTHEELAIIDGSNLDAPEHIGSIVLAENISDYLPLDVAGAKGVAVIQPSNYSSIILRAEAEDGADLGEIELAGGYGHSASTNGSVVALESSVWEDNRARTVVQLVDFSDPANPKELEPVRIDMWPAYRYGWIDYGFNVEPGVDMAKDVAMPWYPVGAVSVVAGDNLVIHGQRYRGNSSETEEVLAVIDLEAGALSGVAVIPEGQGGAILAHGDQVIVHTQSDAGSNLIGQRFVRNYLQFFDPDTLDFTDRANVPGEPIAYEHDVLVLDDWQYTGGFNVERRLRTARWTGGDGAEELDSVNLGSVYGSLVAGGGYVFAPGYEGNGFQVKAYEVQDDGDLDGLSPLATQGWGNVLAADDNGTLYLMLNGNTIARYGNPGAWQLRDATPTTSWTYTVRFGGGSAFIPLGYGGVLELAR